MEVSFSFPLHILFSACLQIKKKYPLLTMLTSEIHPVAPNHFGQKYFGTEWSQCLYYYKWTKLQELWSPSSLRCTQSYVLNIAISDVNEWHLKTYSFWISYLVHCNFHDKVILRDLRDYWLFVSLNLKQLSLNQLLLYQQGPMVALLLSHMEVHVTVILKNTYWYIYM